jgi:hypothetical protein
MQQTSMIPAEPPAITDFMTPFMVSAPDEACFSPFSTIFEFITDKFFDWLNIIQSFSLLIRKIKKNV